MARYRAPFPSSICNESVPRRRVLWLCPVSVDGAHERTMPADCNLRPASLCSTWARAPARWPGPTSRKAWGWEVRFHAVTCWLGWLLDVAVLCPFAA